MGLEVGIARAFLHATGNGRAVCELPGVSQPRVTAMMWLVRIELQRPYTFVVIARLIAPLETGSTFPMPTDVFPAIDILVVCVIWTYNGIAPDDMASRVVTIGERAMTTTVNNIEHIESGWYTRVTSIRVHFQPNATIETGIAQVTMVTQTPRQRRGRRGRLQGSSVARRNFMSPKINGAARIWGGLPAAWNLFVTSYMSVLNC
jgi:hypothetical protein